MSTTAMPRRAAARAPLRVVAGAKSFAEAEWLLLHGADEVYCGLVDLPNHRRDELCLRGTDEFRRVMTLARRLGKRALLLINESCDPARYPELVRKAAELSERGLDGIVLKEPALLEMLTAAGVRSDFILSSLALVFNSRSLGLWARRGVRRVILPYHLPPADARRLVAGAAGLETEMFYYPSHFCQNVDPLCKFCGWSGSYKPCKIPLKSAAGDYAMPVPSLNQLADIMYDGHRAGIGYLKLSRKRDFGALRKFLTEACELSRLLDAGATRAEFRRRYRSVYINIGVAGCRPA